jgi:hypothetical protein
MGNEAASALGQSPLVTGTWKVTALALCVALAASPMSALLAAGAFLSSRRHFARRSGAPSNPRGKVATVALLVSSCLVLAAFVVLAAAVMGAVYFSWVARVATRALPG